MTLSWSDSLALGDAAIDADHREAVEMMHELADAEDAAVPALFEAMVRHMHEHFAREEALMRACRFPAEACHVGEHQRVLALLDDLARRTTPEQTAAARDFARVGGPAWFIDHRNTMDFVTVGFARERGFSA